MDNPLAQLSPQQLAQHLTRLPKAQLHSLLATLLKKLSPLQLTQILATLPQEKLAALIPKLLTCFDRDRLHHLTTQIQAALDHLDLLKTHPP